MNKIERAHVHFKMGNNNGQISAIGLYVQFESSFPFKSFPMRADILNKFTPRDKTGLPNKEQLAKMHEIENIFIEATEPKGIAIYTHSLLLPGQRATTFYIRDHQEFMQCITSTRMPSPEYPDLEIHILDDSEWEDYKEFVKTTSKFTTR